MTKMLKELANANRAKALAKAKASKVCNNIVTNKAINNIAKVNKEINKKASKEAYADLVKRSNHNFKLCIEHQSLIGKLDHVCYSEGLYILNTVTKEKISIF